jgi:GNAT superfamily N-acetyltransferase
MAQDSSTPLVKAFVSHSHKDEEVVRRLGACLERAGIQPWMYKDDLPLGRRIPATVYTQMRTADYCIVVLTAASVRSAWVARELGLATRFHKAAKPSRPQIIGVTAGLATPPRIALRNFETARKQRGAIDFADRRCLALDDCTDDELTRALEGLTPRLTWLSDRQYEPELERQVITCYNDLFPEEERDPWEDIVSWMDEALVPNPTWEPWKEYCAALHLNDAVLGFAYFSFHVRSQWCGGCYFGVQESWRGQNRGTRLLREVGDRMRREWPQAKGILFEIEMVDIQLLEAATHCARLADFPQPNRLKCNIFALARLLIYQSQGCRAFLTRDGRALNVVQPALTDPLDESKERPMILMFLPLHDANSQVLAPEDVLQYWYVEFYGQSHDGSTAARIRDYDTYVARVRDRVLQQAVAEGFVLGVVPLPSKVRQLLDRAVTEGFMESVKLRSASCDD